MATIRSSYPCKLYLIVIPCCVALLALPLWIFCGSVPAVGALVLAALSFLVVRSLTRQILTAQQQKCFLDEQLIQSQKLASIGELSAGIAHEINNPLAIISQEVEWARYNFDGKSPSEINIGELKDSLHEIAHQVDRCREITHKLLDFARKKEPLIQGTDVNRLIEDMAKLVEREASQKSIVIRREYRKDLPPVHTDPPLLRQVVLNLLNNATYAVEKDGTVRIETRVAEQSDIEIVISDTGCGIPKADLSKIFDPFFTTKPPGKGTGLGLSICHSIIVRLGGRITVETEPGKGSAFTIRLPIVFNSPESE
ncbi:MAG: hypothetical protein LLG06_14505 [Desulfobacteraceae bacterium]|nr:hypothetical protein [Desulfobacteraceae bacterium]